MHLQRARAIAVNAPVRSFIKKKEGKERELRCSYHVRLFLSVRPSDLLGTPELSDVTPLG